MADMPGMKTSGTKVDDKGLSLLSNGHHDMIGTEEHALNPTDRKTLSAQIAATIDVAKKYPTAADALAALAGHRRDALWGALGLMRDTHLFNAPADTEIATLLAPTEADNIFADYKTIGLTLRRHPLALLRDTLTAQRIRSAEEIRNARPGQLIRAAGLVTCRQRPGTAKGTTFVTLEDETGYVNVVVWSHVAARQRKELVLSRLMGVAGRVEKQGEVVHLIAGRLFDHSAMLGALHFGSRDFH